jgi:hypothetical protein
MGSLYTNELLPATSEQAIRIFDERYLAGISAVQPPSWAEQFGDSVPLGAPRVTFPIGLMSTKYLETREVSGRFKTMMEEAFDLKVIEYDAGYEAKLLELKTNTYAYRKWSETASRFLIAEKRHVNRAIATMLETGTVETSPWDNVAFFSASHKANPTGDPATTWGNYQGTPTDVVDIAKLTAEVTAMQNSVLDENGEKLGADPDTILVSTPKYEPLRVLLSQAMILGSGTATAPTSNPYMGKFNVVHSPELTDGDDWYLIDSKLMAAQGVPAWVAAKYQPAADLGLRYWDETSDFFKDSGKIKVSSHIWYGFRLVFPHAIRLVRGA